MNEPIAGLNARNPWSWYPVAASADLEAGKVMPVVLNGEPLVVWRSQGGRANAWSDRCPHRGMRLSFGAVQREELICPYHGWTFGTDGHCNRIPAHPDTAPSRAARSRIYPSIEMNGYVWVCIGEPASDRPDDADPATPVRTMHLGLDVQDAKAALLLYPLDQHGTITAPFSSDALEWKQTGAALTVTASTEEIRFVATLTLSGALACLVETPRGTTRYRALFQPTEPSACALQLASDTSDPAGLNAALVGFRHAVMQEIDAGGIERVRGIFMGLMPDQVHA